MGIKFRKWTEEEEKQIRIEEQRILANIDKLPPERQMLVRIAERNRRYQDAKKAGIPEVGLFFVVGEKVFAYGGPYTEITPHAGFRTFDVDHHVYWRQLQQMGAVPADVEYDQTSRGRVTYEDSSRRFTLFADKCIIKNKKAISRIMSEFRLPTANTKVLPDDHYRCPGCTKRTKKQEVDDWNF